tara:strand:- start:203 stop:463 length:261 start_codon:yes stop_codon:yes gene_type:complete
MKKIMKARRELTGTAPARKVATRDETLVVRETRAEKPRPSQADLEFLALQQQINIMADKQAALTGRVLTRKELGHAATEAAKSKGT